MNRTFSLYLDLTRFLAALVVALSHWAYPRLTDGNYIFIRELNIGGDAVMFFFVLSGLVIAYTAQVKDVTGKHYAFSRITRIYSVAVPALLLTIILDRIGLSINPASYDGFWYKDAPIWKQLLLGLTFTNEWGSKGLRLGTNGPYWSLSYEVFYYLIFGLVVFWRSKYQPFVLVALMVAAGPVILLLFPAWIAGVVVYHKFIAREVKLWLPPAFFVFLPIVFYIYALMIELPFNISLFAMTVLNIDIIPFRQSYDFMWTNVVALLISIHLIGVAALCRQHQKEISPFIARAIRWSAGASFSIYLIHYPMLQFLDAVLPESMAAPLRHASLLILTLVAAFIFAECSERRLNLIRRLLLRPDSPQRTQQ